MSKYEYCSTARHRRHQSGTQHTKWCIGLNIFISLYIIQHTKLTQIGMKASCLFASPKTRGMNECTNFRCPSYLASAETVRDPLLPAETVVLGK